MEGICFFTDPQVDTCCDSGSFTWALPEGGSLAYGPIKKKKKKLFILH